MKEQKHGKKKEIKEKNKGQETAKKDIAIKGIKDKNLQMEK